MSLCIWCKKEVTKNTLEHIIPEALGCPEDFVLKNGEMCNSCNGNLGNIDHALVNAFDIFAFLSGVPRKKGRKPKVDNKGNFYAHHTENGAEIHSNMNKKSIVSKDGKILGGYGKSKRNVKSKTEFSGNTWKSDFSFQIGDDPKLVRALYKIGLESLVYFLGSKIVLNKSYDSIRNYVLNGDGDRKVIFKLAEDLNYKNEVQSPKVKKDVGYVVFARIATIEFVIDLTEDEVLLPDFEKILKKQLGETGWGIFPVKA